MKPKFTDSHKFGPKGYVPSVQTDITETWARAQKQIDADKKEREEKVREIKQIGVKR